MSGASAAPPPGPGLAKPIAIPVESSVWDRLTNWASENKALVYTIAGVAVVVSGAGVVYYLNGDAVSHPSNCCPTGHPTNRQASGHPGLLVCLSHILELTTTWCMYL